MIAKIYQLVIQNLPLLVAVTLAYGLIYITTQQTYRQGANDPQIQMSRDIATRLNAGANPSELIPAEKIDAEKSLAPFVIIFTRTGKIEASNVLIAGSIPTVPTGVLEAAKASGENRVTWQTTEGVRIAAVAKSADNFVVLAGRNLSEVESREQHLFNSVLAAGVLTLLAILVAAGLKLKLSSIG